MSVASELSSEVAEAILVGELDTGDVGSLLEVVFALHATLRQLSREARRQRRSKILLETPPAQGWSVVPGSH